MFSMKSIKEITFFLVLAIGVASTVGFQKNNNPKEKLQINDHNKGFAVIELFTSEGCWSCPPADELIGKLAKENTGKQIYILAFHVDYWDHQGWKDRFSDPQYTARQQQYSSWMNLNTIYTPQMVINGQIELVGSDKPAVVSAINKATMTSHSYSLVLKTRSSNNRRVEVNYTYKGVDKDSNIVIALVQKTAGSNVKAGENKGKILSHAQIVRELQQQPVKTSDKLSFRIPKDMGEGEIIAFVQQQNTGKITAATRHSL